MRGRGGGGGVDVFTLLKTTIFQEDVAFIKVLNTRFPRFQNGYKFDKSMETYPSASRVVRLLNRQVD